MTYKKKNEKTDARRVFSFKVKDLNMAMTIIELCFYAAFFKVWIGNLQTDESVIAFFVIMLIIFARVSYELYKQL